jgi:hypothetical protein
MSEVETAPRKLASKPANDPAIFAVRGTAHLDTSGQEPPAAPQFEGPVQWEEFLRFPGPLDGYIVAGRLNAEGVPTLVAVDPLALAFSRPSAIWVPRHLIHRARWILAWSVPSEAELTYLATGELASEPGPGEGSR